MKRPALEYGGRIASAEVRCGIKAERSVVIGYLVQPDPGIVSPVRFIDDGLHQVASHAPVLCLRINGDRTDAANTGPEVNEVAAADVPVVLGDHRVELRVVHQHRGPCVANLDGGNIGWKL